MQSHEDQQTKKIKTAKHDKDKWLQIIAEWQRSGESQKQFCQRHDLNIATFAYMKGQLQPRNKITKLKTFIPVISVPENKVLADIITIENKIGLKMHIPLSLRPDQLIHLLSLLGWRHA